MSQTILNNADLRLADLIAKTAGINLRETLCVLSSLLYISKVSGVPADELLAGTELDYSLPSPENRRVCEHAYFELGQMAEDKNDPEIKRAEQAYSRLLKARRGG